MGEDDENEAQRNGNQGLVNQENKEEEEAIQNQENRNLKRRKKLFWILGIFVVLLITVGIFTGITYQKVNSFANSITSQDAKLLERETNASSMTSKLSYNDFVTETNMIMDERSKLISKAGNYKALLFKNKIETLKYNLLNENQKVKTDQVGRLKKELATAEKKDNIAMGDFISIAVTDNNLTWKESFDKLNKNINDRDKMINDIKNIEMLSYASQISDYITLLNSENKLVRSYSQSLHTMFNLSIDMDLYDPYFDNSSDIKADKKEIISDFAEFQKDYNDLLAKDKAFWPNVNGLMPSRDLEKALSDFYNKTHDTLKPLLT